LAIGLNFVSLLGDKDGPEDPLLCFETALQGPEAEVCSPTSTTPTDNLRYITDLDMSQGKKIAELTSTVG